MMLWLWANLAKNRALRWGEGKDEPFGLQELTKHSLRILITSSICSSLKYIDRDIARNKDFYGFVAELRTLVKLFAFNYWSKAFSYFCIGTCKL